MDLSLNWDLVILGVFVLLFAYNFILGQNANIKLVLSLYISAFVADGITGILQEILLSDAFGFKILIEDIQAPLFVSLRLMIFLIANVLFVTKGAFVITVKEHPRGMIRFALHGLFSFLASLLFLATLLMYLSGHSLIEGMSEIAPIAMFGSSGMAKLLVYEYPIWFTMPALLFILSSFFFPKDK